MFIRTAINVPSHGEEEMHGPLEPVARTEGERETAPGGSSHGLAQGFPVERRTGTFVLKGYGRRLEGLLDREAYRFRGSLFAWAVRFRLFI